MDTRSGRSISPEAAAVLADAIMQSIGLGGQQASQKPQEDTPFENAVVDYVEEATTRINALNTRLQDAEDELEAIRNWGTITTQCLDALFDENQRLREAIARMGGEVESVPPKTPQEFQNEVVASSLRTAIANALGIPVEMVIFDGYVNQDDAITEQEQESTEDEQPEPESVDEVAG